MIKDRLTEAIEANYDKIQKGDDYIPVGMRGELEVIVKDRDGNVLSYERDHNQVTKLAKMALLHLLAGEIGTSDSNVYSMPEGQDKQYRRTYTTDETTSIKRQIVSGFTPTNHTSQKNSDGQLVSGEQYFFEGSSCLSDSVNTLAQVMPKDVAGTGIKFNFPTKMLFGTGLEAHDTQSIPTKYSQDFGTQLDAAAILTLNGYSASGNEIPASFLDGCSSDQVVTGYTPDQQKRLSNWYSADAYRSRTLQPASSNFLKSTLNSEVTAISGAIKNCFIEDSVADYNLYNPTTKMALAPYRGFGYPCFVYAKRSTNSFFDNSKGNRETYYGINDNLVGSVPYETEVTYTVVMPAQPVASDSITTFYPYNGWVLRQAGLFCDSRYKLRTVDAIPSTTVLELSEDSFIDKIDNGDEEASNNAHNYRDNVGGQLLFVRNLSSPILKTADQEVTFIWHIFITV